MPKNAAPHSTTPFSLDKIAGGSGLSGVAFAAPSRGTIAPIGYGRVLVIAIEEIIVADIVAAPFSAAIVPTGAPC